MSKKLLLASVATAIMMAVMTIHGHPLVIPQKTPCGILSLELARIPTKAAKVIEAWTPGLLNLARVNTYLDFLFIASYGTLLWLVCTTLASRFTGRWQTIGRWLAIAVIVASAFDVFENILMFKILSGRTGNELVASTFMFAATKFVLLGMAIAYSVACLLANLPVFKRLAIQNKPTTF